MIVALVMVHYVTLALLLFGFLQSLPVKKALPVLVWGARLQLLSGLALAAAGSMATGDQKVGGMFIGVKLIIMLVVVGLVEVSAAKGKRDEQSAALLYAAGVLALVNVVVAYALPH
ncbi:hypothetical protein MM440_10270 [Arsenicicoccus piscis]|nr:hypothetical protein [Arsenicicoccus piscis]MCH8628151.1 hypothetical protein [Arsenicicoccus piscis]